MDKAILIVMCVFLLAGGVDYLFGSPLKLGGKFEEGIKTMGPLALGMVGIYSLSPAILTLIRPVATGLSTILPIDPSILPAMIFPVDMGGFPISSGIARTAEIGLFSGIIIASQLGAAVSFSIPVALSMVSREDHKDLAKGILIGTIAIVPGALIAGLFMGIGTISLLVNMLPMIVIVLILSIGLLRFPEQTLRAFFIFGKFIMALSIAGLILQAFFVLLGIKIIPDMVPFQDTVFIVGKIALILGGAYPMTEILSRLIKLIRRKSKKQTRLSSDRMSEDRMSEDRMSEDRMSEDRMSEDRMSANTLSADTLSAVVGNLASNILVWGKLKDMDGKGKVLCSSLAVSSAFVLGGQFAYVASVAPSAVGPFLIAKISSGLFSVLLAFFFMSRSKRPAMTNIVNKSE